MIDDVGTIESSGDEEIIEKSKNNSEKIKSKQTPAKLVIGEEWMNDDVGTMDSSDDEEEEKAHKTPLALPMPSYSDIASKEKTYVRKDENQKIAESVIAAVGPHMTLVVAHEEEKQQLQEEVDNDGFKSVISKQEKRHRKKSHNSFSESLDKISLKPVIGEEWMIDDVGTIESSDEEETSEIYASEGTAGHKEEKVETSMKPVIGEEWMIDDVGTMESSDDEEEKAYKPLALPMPSYSDIASKEKTYNSQDENQQPAASVIAALGPHLTLVVADEKEKPQSDVEVDGFKSVISKQEKRIRKKSHNSFSEKLEQGPPKPVIGMEWMIDDVGTIESSDDEEVIVESVKVIAVNETANNIDYIKQGPSKPVIGKELMIDDVGTMESSDDEEIIKNTKVDAPKKQEDPVLKLEKNKESSVKPDIGEEWMIDDVGTIESSDDEEIAEESKNIDPKQEELKEISVKPTIIGEEWMIDDVGTIQSSDDEEISKSPKIDALKKQAVPVLTVEEKKESSVKPIIGEEWMIDDVGTMSSSDDEENIESTNIGTSDKQADSSSAVEKKKETSVKPVIGEEWMIDDVGTMSLSDDEKNVIDSIKVIEASKPDDFASKPVIGEEWMIDDVGTIESSDEEEKEAQKLLALPMPKYSDIAAKEQINIMPTENQKAAEIVIAAPGPHITLVVADEENLQHICEEIDAEGFVSVVSKQEKRNRKRSQSSLSENVDRGHQNIELQTKPTIGEEWMIDDVGTIESSDDEEMVKSTKVPETPAKPNIGEEWMIDDVGTMESSDDEGESDKQEKIKDGRLSSLSVAQRFSCDDDEQFEELILESESTEQPSAEETSWAFIVSSKEKEKQEDAPKVQHSGEIKEMPCPPLVIEIIDKEEPKLDIDKDGYRVVSNKNKSKRKSEKSKTLPYDIIDKLDQPVGSRPFMEEIVQTQDENEEISFEANEANEEQSKDLKKEIKAVKNISKEEKQGKDEEEGSKNTDPWLALKDEYIRLDAETQEAEGYTIDVKVSTKETCIGRKLHSPEATEWKMDIQCVQQDSCPDIIDKSVHMDKVPASNTLYSGSSQISLAPSWMRRGLTENENRKQAGIQFENLKGKERALAKDNANVDSKEERSEEEEIYYRIKNKMKKKRRRTTSNTSQTSSNSNSLPRPDSKESLVNKVKTPLIKLHSTTSSIAMEVGSTNSSFDRRDLDLDNDLSISDKSVSVEKDDDDVNQSSEIIINFDDSKSTNSNMLEATEKLRAVSPNQPHFVSYQRQTSRDMEDAVEVQRPIRKISSSENTLQPVLSIDSTIGPGEKDSVQNSEDKDGNAKMSEIKKKWSDIASKAVHLQKIESLEKQPSPVENKTETIILCDEEPKHKEEPTLDKDGFETIERKRGKRSRRNTESVHEDPPVQSDIVSAAFSYDIAMIEAAETKYQEQLAKRASSEAQTDNEIKAEEVEKSKTAIVIQPMTKDEKQSELSKIKEAMSSSPSKKKKQSPRLGQDLLKNISDEKFWLDRHIYEEAEYRYFEKKVKVKTPLLKSSNMSDDSDKDDSGSKDTSSDKSKEKENKESKEEKDRSSPTEEFYNWTDESTYLSPSIPVFSPPPISLEKPLAMINEESSLSLNVSANELQVTLIALLIYLFCCLFVNW